MRFQRRKTFFGLFRALIAKFQLSKVFKSFHLSFYGNLSNDHFVRSVSSDRILSISFFHLLCAFFVYIFRFISPFLDTNLHLLILILIGIFQRIIFHPLSRSSIPRPPSLTHFTERFSNVDLHFQQKLLIVCKQFRVTSPR